MFSNTDVRITLGRTTTTATLAKIDPDTGLAQDLGPGTLNFLTATVLRPFRFGAVRADFSKADARDDDTGLPPPKLLVRSSMHSRHSIIFHGDSAAAVRMSTLATNCSTRAIRITLANLKRVPMGETRIALVRPFLKGQLELGADGEIARGYTGQTTETFAPSWEIRGPPPACASGVDGIANN